jgi:hypothetical protein
MFRFRAFEPIPLKNFGRILGSFEPIFDSNFGVKITLSISQNYVK